MALSDVGGNIRRYMKINGYTISRLAEKSGISKATLSNLLNGKAPYFYVDTLILLFAVSYIPYSRFKQIPKYHSTEIQEYSSPPLKRSSRIKVSNYLIANP